MVHEIKEDAALEKEYRSLKTVEGFSCKNTVSVTSEGWRESATSASPQWNVLSHEVVWLLTAAVTHIDTGWWILN